jgi:hypothetical protein
MHPVITSQITAARIGDLQCAAERHATAQAARRARRSPAPRRLPLAAALSCRVRGPLAARGLIMPLRSRPLPACPSEAPCTSCA